MRERKCKLNVYLNQDEKDLLEINSEKTGLTKSELIRNLIAEIKLKEKPPEEFYNDIALMKKLRKDLNYSIRRLNYLGYVEDGKNLKIITNKLNKLMDNVSRKYL